MVGGQRHSQAAFIPRKDPVPIVEEAGWTPGPVWTDAENLALTGIRSPDRPARSESLYHYTNIPYLFSFHKGTRKNRAHQRRQFHSPPAPLPKIKNGTFRVVLVLPYQGVIYLQTVTRFQGTCLRTAQLSLSLFLPNSQMLNSITYSSLTYRISLK